MENWYQYVIIFLASMFKFFFGIFTAINSSIGVVPSFTTNLIGGGVGVVFFTYLGAWIKQKLNDYLDKKPSPIVDNYWTKFQNFIRVNFGLLGIAILSPIVFSIPVGVGLALQVTRNKQKIVLYLFASCIFWSLVFFILDHFFNFHFFQK